MNRIFSKSSRLLFTAGCIMALAAPISYAGHDSAHSTPADNSRVNSRDRSSNLRTADRQGMNKSDTEITRRIRKGLMGNDALSTYGKNVKVITQKGHVTLRGAVKSAEERDAITTQAKDIAGAKMVKDELQVVTN